MDFLTVEGKKLVADFKVRNSMKIVGSSGQKKTFY
jgi:hypothetical protein